MQIINNKISFKKKKKKRGRGVIAGVEIAHVHLVSWQWGPFTNWLDLHIAGTESSLDALNSFFFLKRENRNKFHILFFCVGGHLKKKPNSAGSANCAPVLLF